MKIKFLQMSWIMVVLSLNINALASDYPQSRHDQEVEEMGSLAGGAGISFHPSKIKSTATKAVTEQSKHVNKYLYQAAISVLKEVPLVSSDASTGIILTDWYGKKDHPNKQFKVTAQIKDSVISASSLDIVAFSRQKVSGEWSTPQKAIAISAALEEEILRKSRDLYMQSCK